MTRTVAVLMDPIAGIHPEKDSTLAMLLANYLEVALRGTVVSRAVLSLLHRAGALVDRSSPKLRDVRQGSLIANFHVVADVAGQRAGNRTAGSEPR